MFGPLEGVGNYLRSKMGICYRNFDNRCTSRETRTSTSPFDVLPESSLILKSWSR